MNYSRPDRDKNSSELVFALFVGQEFRNSQFFDDEQLYRKIRKLYFWLPFVLNRISN